MALAALADTEREFADYVLEPLAREGDAAVRMIEVQRRLLDFYRSGRRPCLLETLCVAGAPEPVLRHARATLAFWTARFAQLAEECGMTPAAAKEAAEDAIPSLEGALVTTRIQGKTPVFQRL